MSNLVKPHFDSLAALEHGIGNLGIGKTLFCVLYIPLKDDGYTNEPLIEEMVPLGEFVYRSRTGGWYYQKAGDPGWLSFTIHVTTYDKGRSLITTAKGLAYFGGGVWASGKCFKAGTLEIPNVLQHTIGRMVYHANKSTHLT